MASTPQAGPRLDQLAIAESERSWERLGFATSDGLCAVGAVVLRLDPGAGSGIAGWRLSGLPSGAAADVDGLPTDGPLAAAVSDAPAEHPNGALAIDHVVVLTDELERTAAALEAAGARLRRVRGAGRGSRRMRQGFFRLGEVILEAVEIADDDRAPRGRASFWGITFTVADLERCAQVAGERLGRARDAVQPGRRIAPVRADAGLGLAVAFMTPPPPRDG